MEWAAGSPEMGKPDGDGGGRQRLQGALGWWG
ncbi:hypothetical protein MRB53_032874, partial [Persea americana]